MASAQKQLATPRARVVERGNVPQRHPGSFVHGKLAMVETFIIFLNEEIVAHSQCNFSDYQTTLKFDAEDNALLKGT